MHGPSFWIQEKYLQFPTTVLIMGSICSTSELHNPEMSIHIHDAMIPGALALVRSLAEGHGMSCPTSN